MKSLAYLLEHFSYIEIKGNIDLPISELTMDSRLVKPGDLFICQKGHNFNGHDFIPQAVQAGAIAIIYDEQNLNNLPEGITAIRVTDTDEILPSLSACFYDNPSSQMHVYAIVGTNGKTTSTYLLKAVLEEAGYHTGLIGTIKYMIGQKEFNSKNTTPNALELQKIMAQMVTQGITHLVMEVSSHAIKLGRIKNCHFKGAIFTNITQDHLDFHKTFTEYLEVKKSFFRDLPSDAWAAINFDDTYGKEFAEAINANLVTFSRAGKTDISIDNLDISPNGSTFQLYSKNQKVEINLYLTGEYNISNALGVLALAMNAENIPLAIIKKGLASVTGVSGRLEKVQVEASFTILVDYAHTPDALENVLKTVRKITPQHLLTIFGCGGDRDRTKRPIMGRIAQQYADHIFITSDNPRSEEPAQIINDIMEGIDKFKKDTYQVIIDRREAIFTAIKMAKAGDIIVIAGKGHETYQIFADRTIHFDDREVAQEAIKELRIDGKLESK